MIADLPAPARDLAMRLGAQSDAARSIVSLTQAGRMKRKLGAESWLSFGAAQTISTDSCCFAWQARFGPLGMITVSDTLDGGGGRLQATALGFIPLARAGPTPALTRGELMRYLGEIALAPDIILANPSLNWRSDGADRLVVGAGTGALAADVTLTLDSDGRIGSIFAPDRPRSPTGPFLPTPWRGRFWDYRQHRGRWLPFAAEVAWEVDGTSETYWKAEMTSWDINPA